MIMVMFFAQLFLIALINLIAFSWFEEEEDVCDQHYSILQRFRESQIMRLISILFVLFFILIFAALLLHLNKDLLLVETVFFFMAVSLATIIWKKEYFKLHERYRFIGDGIFLFPLFILLSYVA